MKVNFDTLFQQVTKIIIKTNILNLKVIVDFIYHWEGKFQIKKECFGGDD